MDSTETQQVQPAFESDMFLENDIFQNRKAVELTIREREILSLILEGRTNKEIARSLCRVERTVEYHRNSLMHKFEAHNSTQLMKKAIEMGLVTI